MRIAPIADLKARLSTYINESDKGPIVVTRNGKPVAVLLSVNDEEELERLLIAYSPKVRHILDAGQRQIREGRGIGHEEFWQEVES